MDSMGPFGEMLDLHLSNQDVGKPALAHMLDDFPIDVNEEGSHGGINGAG
jgi:hypothetical protein